MMSNRSSDPLFQLIHSLQKGEKRNFKLYIQRNTSNEDLKIVQLFDVLDRMSEYDEALVLQKIVSIRKEQLANRKAHLYKQLLASLRVLELADNIDISLHEQLGHARILYNKGLYIQSLKLLEKAKLSARTFHQHSFLVQIIFLEKKIESLHITRSLQNRSKNLIHEAEQVSTDISVITRLSNLSLELYSWYINNGHARNEKDEKMLHDFFHFYLPQQPSVINGFYQSLYLYQSYSWYTFILQDYLLYYRYTQKWVDLFAKDPAMIEIETVHYIKGLHNLLGAHFDLRNYERFDEIMKLFEKFSQSDLVQKNENNSVQVFVYLYTARINRHFMYGSFTEGVKLVPELNKKLEQYALYLDRHRVLVFYYKIASLYFGSGDLNHTIDYLNKIINWKVDLRTDLQCYARLLHLIAHYELGNFNLLEYLVKSVYRFMSKMENMNPAEEAVFKFLQRAFHLDQSMLKPEFEKLLIQLKAYENNPLASRAFAYLDIISWLQSKIDKVPVQEIIQMKAVNHKRNLQVKN